LKERKKERIESGSRELRKERMTGKKQLRLFSGSLLGILPIR
jgi:hypothetical protein